MRQQRDVVEHGPNGADTGRFEHDDELNEDAEDARDAVMKRLSNYDVTNPGPDTANFPNSAFTKSVSHLRL